MSQTEWTDPVFESCSPEAQAVLRGEPGDYSPEVVREVIEAIFQSADFAFILRRVAFRLLPNMQPGQLKNVLEDLRSEVILQVFKILSKAKGIKKPSLWRITSNVCMRMREPIARIASCEIVLRGEPDFDQTESAFEDVETLCSLDALILRIRSSQFLWKKFVYLCATMCEPTRDTLFSYLVHSAARSNDPYSYIKANRHIVHDYSPDIHLSMPSAAPFRTLELCCCEIEKQTHNEAKELLGYGSDHTRGELASSLRLK